MSNARRHTVPSVLVGSITLLIALSASLLSACGGSTNTHVTVTPTPTLSVPKDPAPVTVVAGKATTLDLGGGADLTIPPGAMTPGATVYATYRGRPNGNWTAIAPTFAPVELISNPPDAIHGLLTLEFPVPADKIMPSVDPAAQFGISTYDSSAKIWMPVQSQYDRDRHMVVALIPHFSWYGSFQWDINGLFARILQDFGQLVGERAGPPTCSGGTPTWLEDLGDVLKDAGLAIRSCAQSQENILDIEIVNNRPYGQILTYGSSVKWGWHQVGDSPADSERNRLMDFFTPKNQLYLPPLGRASVGIFQTAAGSRSVFHIGPTGLSAGVDLAFAAYVPIAGSLMEKAVDGIVSTGGCASFVTQARLNGVNSTSALRDDLTAAGDCLETGFKSLAASGVMDKLSIRAIETLNKVIKGAKVAGLYIQIGDYTWKLADLFSDWWENHTSEVGNGFLVYAKLAPPPPTVTPVPPPHPNPTVTPVPPPSPSPTWTEQQGSHGANSFANPHNASGMGPHLDAMAYVQVSCKLYDPTIVSVNPDGYWYRIASAPWNNGYYIAANTFWNGDVPGVYPYTHNTDWNVPDC